MLARVVRFTAQTARATCPPCSLTITENSAPFTQILCVSECPSGTPIMPRSQQNGAQLRTNPHLHGAPRQSKQRTRSRRTCTAEWCKPYLQQTCCTAHGRIHRTPNDRICGSRQYQEQEYLEAKTNTPTVEMKRYSSKMEKKDCRFDGD